MRKPTLETVQGGALLLHYSANGIPDIICCYKGRFLGLEVKQPGGRVTALQQRAIERINRAGGVARRVESVADVRMIISGVDEEQKQTGERP